MSAIMADWRAKKAQEDEELHQRLRAAVLARRVEVYTDQRMLDFQGSPVHNGWDHLAPLLGLMSLALAILLATGVAIGIVAMTLGALGHLLGIKHFVAWRIRARAKAYMLESAAHLQQLWQLGGIALVVMGSSEPPCLGPRGDWRKFVRRNLPAEGQPAPSSEADAEELLPNQEILPP
ncbi:MAG TPA: hypothetical protein VK196_11570 [Magnetospirillum sp.]|nr:hypothetical protein [Magnetospirillum sp.]